MDAIDLALRDACRESGCPLCHLRLAGERRYLLGVLGEFVNDAFIRQRFLASGGYCPAHIRQLQALEQERWGDGLGNAILCEDLLTHTLRGLEAYRDAWAAAGERRGRRKRRVPRPRALIPGARCRVCEFGEALMARYVPRLVRAAEEQGELWRAYTASEGLCWPHLQVVLESLDAGAAEAGVRLLEDVIRRVQALTTALAAYIQAHDYRYQNEPLTAEVQLAWLRAVAWLAGGATL